MSMTHKTFQDCLMMYGTEPDYWPEAIRAQALQAQSMPGFAALLDEQRAFDSMLLENAPFVPASKDLEDRILFAARMAGNAQNVFLVTWFQEVFGPVSRRSTFMFASIILVGFLIGFYAPSLLTSRNDNDFIQTAMNDGGNL